jgi:hypothetical protein
MPGMSMQQNGEVGILAIKKGCPPGYQGSARNKSFLSPLFLAPTSMMGRPGSFVQLHL